MKGFVVEVWEGGLDEEVAFPSCLIVGEVVPLDFPLSDYLFPSRHSPGISDSHWVQLDIAFRCDQRKITFRDNFWSNVLFNWLT
jgi:hypothetical protein